ncbi:MAG: hypothetical protein A2508_07520 [Candidatus Lambdaproteobacteria bacterium RIFOXYD12_FULL_49_8]|uniref:Uncharacterized protein n=1 Tax=Candidatus Lambdaproteobacteria bacterium RIFOXYD2_FULL_50_16 TaxID=1817772 RepID=A0A1F6GAQ6_9PROT|nr:MAG: hypothetical protein A2527_08445 [Candidatus Lambdaproteobacteria bacterium RIFOXYD2_FULL_50_16]OGG98103.1 MAG: hypothetical protein A2508_07520 [Candidatus Lambdaproteobacteria bacterium RIFOXYD12_FULL_49_8]
MQRPLEVRPVPFSFIPLFAQALHLYKSQFGNLFILGILSFLPFWGLDFLLKGLDVRDLNDLIELFHGFLLDILVFLALPTLLNYGRVYPLATLKIFQDYFGTGVVLVLFQIFALFFSLLFFSQFGFIMVTFGLVPFVFVLFIGHFMLVNGTPQFSGLKQSFLNSISLVRSFFVPVFFGYLNISILMITPIFLFSMVYLKGHPEMAQWLEVSTNPDTPIDLPNLMEMLQRIVSEFEYQGGRLGIHLVFRPLKAVFMALLFARLLELSAPEKHSAYLGIPEEIKPISEV